MKLLEIIKADYQRFPLDQTYTIYAPDVYFQDPLNRFVGIAQYQNMIGFISRWFRNIHLDLHDIKQVSSDPENTPEIPLENNPNSKIITQWTLSWHSPLPWEPRISIPGWSELEVNSQGLIISHLDYWHCSVWDVIRQHFQ